MDIKDIKKAGVNNADEIDIKEYELKEKDKKIKFEEIKIKKEEPKKKAGNKFKKFLKKFWFIVWKDESFKGWIISLIFIFVIIKFVFFPVLNLVTGTDLPLAIVESCSMYHKGDLLGSYENWFDRHEQKYSEFNIDNSEFANFNLRKGFNKGDILFIVKANPDKIKIGDVIIFNANQRNPVIHRVINITEDSSGKRIFSTMGDNNYGQLPSEVAISEDQLVGKAALRIAPFIGWSKLIFFEHQKSSYEKGFCNEN